MVEVLTSFCARLYGRGAKNRAKKALEAVHHAAGRRRHDRPVTPARLLDRPADVTYLDTLVPFHSAGLHAASMRGERTDEFIAGSRVIR